MVGVLGTMWLKKEDRNMDGSVCVCVRARVRIDDV